MASTAMFQIIPFLMFLFYAALGIAAIVIPIVFLRLYHQRTVMQREELSALREALRNSGLPRP